MLSGAGALGFELLWVRLLGLAFGAETLGVLAVLAGFFGGLAIGAAAFHRPVCHAPAPIWVYAACEVVIAVYGLASPWLLLRLSDAVPPAIGPLIGDNQSPTALAVNLLIAAAILLPATVAIGVTTVALVEAWRRVLPPAEAHRSVGRLYAANTFGATAGVALATYWLFPLSGAAGTAPILAGLCLGAAALAIWWRRTVPVSRPEISPKAGEDAEPAAAERRGLYVLLLLTGLGGIGLETVGTMVLSQIFENTVYTFANILAVFLVGTAAGAWLYTRWGGRLARGHYTSATGWLLLALALSVVLSAIPLGLSAALLGALAPAGSGYHRSVGAEVAVAAAVFVLPTVLMGAVFSHLTGRFARGGVGRAYALNTLGSSVAPFLFGLLLVPRAGYAGAFLGLTLLYAGVFAGFCLWRAQPRRFLVTGLVALGVASAVVPSSLVLVRPPAGYRVVAQAQGLYGTVMISERPFSTGRQETTLRLLQVNQNFLMGGALGFQEKRMGHLALLLAPRPREVLFLGVGTGITAGTALVHDGVERVVAVELVPEVRDFVHWFAAANHGLRDDPRVALQTSDARRFLRASRDRYDVIVADLFHPWQNGAGFLYTREHFLAAREHLRPGGLFVQWLPLYQLTERDLQTMVRTFLDVFPRAHSVLGTYGSEAALALIAWRPAEGAPAGGVDAERAARLLARWPGPREVIAGVPDLLASYMLDADALRRYAGPGPINTDLNQRILFDSPSSLGSASGAILYRSLETIVPYRRPFPDDFLRPAHPEAAARWREAAEPFSRAVTHFLGGDIARRKSAGSELPQAAVEAYLRAYRADPTFQPAGRMLVELAGRHPDAAGEILRRMAEANPQDTALARAAQRLGGVSDRDGVIAILRDYLFRGG